VLSLIGDYKRVFNLPTLVSEGETEMKPKVSSGAMVKIKTPILRKVVSDSQKMGEEMVIEAKEQVITFRTSSLNGSVVSTFKSGDDSIVELGINQESKASYDLDLLATIIKNASSVSEHMKIEYSTNQPMRLDLGIPQGKLHLYVSPRIEA